MKVKQAIPAILAACLICAGQVNSANAYFTTYVTAKGGYVVNWEYHNKIKETFDNWKKCVIISSDPGSIPTYVRVKAFSGSKYTLNYPANSDWTLGKDDFYYYNKPLLEGTDSTGLMIEINDVPTSPRKGDNFNVVVVYEAIPVKYDADGNLVKPWECDWENPLGTAMEDNNVVIPPAPDTTE
ncbi:MAG: hypothetical protein HUJ70_14690 [Pseudobutyrivibrio sp.]|nr:hypothetical protein [Pseudobutyrivibrio sp.]MCF0186190.1 hypothetical protein [Bacteroidaceae bacterium]